MSTVAPARPAPHSPDDDVNNHRAALNHCACVQACFLPGGCKYQHQWGTVTTHVSHQSSRGYAWHSTSTRNPQWSLNKHGSGNKFGEAKHSSVRTYDIGNEADNNIGMHDMEIDDTAKGPKSHSLWIDVSYARNTRNGTIWYETDYTWEHLVQPNSKCQKNAQEGEHSSFTSSRHHACLQRLVELRGFAYYNNFSVQGSNCISQCRAGLWPWSL